MKPFNAKSNIVSYPQFMDVKSEIERQLSQQLEWGDGEHLTLIGPSGMGKSTMLQSILIEHPVDDTGTRRAIKILFVEVPETPTRDGLADAFLLALGDHVSTRLALNKKKPRIVELIRKCGVQMLMLDETQHITKGTDKATVDTADWIKTLCNAVDIPIVIAGLEPLNSLHQSNTQFRRRFSRFLYLPPLSVDSDDDLRLFAAVFAGLTDGMPISCPHGLNTEFLTTLHFATGGLLDYMARVITEACWCAGKRDSPIVDIQDFDSAFVAVVWRRCPPHRNPFRSAFNGKPLVERDEPFWEAL